MKAELLAREPIFHKPEFGTRTEDYLAMTAEDYWEVGASGRVYEREGVVRGLVARGKVPGDDDWVVSDVKLRRPADDTYAITYQLDQAGRLTPRKHQLEALRAVITASPGSSGGEVAAKESRGCPARESRSHVQALVWARRLEDECDSGGAACYAHRLFSVASAT